MVIVAAVSNSDQSRAIAAQADELARTFDDELHLVHIIEETEYTALLNRTRSTVQR